MNEDLKWLAENVHEWPQHHKYVVVWYENTSPKISWGFGTAYGESFTREQWQAARDELGLNHSVKPAEKVWRGPEDGLPPVGEMVEAWFDDGRSCWHKAHVVGYHPSEENTLAVSLIGDHESRLIWSYISGIRPDSTEEDKVIQEMLCIMEGGAGERAARALYRAGYRQQAKEVQS